MFFQQPYSKTAKRFWMLMCLWVWVFCHFITRRLNVSKNINLGNWCWWQSCFGTSYKMTSLENSISLFSFNPTQTLLVKCLRKLWNGKEGTSRCRELEKYLKPVQNEEAQWRSKNRNRKTPTSIKLDFIFMEEAMMKRQQCKSAGLNLTYSSAFPVAILALYLVFPRLRNIKKTNTTCSELHVGFWIAQSQLFARKIM